jgi:hypothetical protein
MALPIQYDFFKPIPTETECLQLEIDSLRESMNKMRKSLFARENALSKMAFDLHDRLDILERNICRGTK